jgi:hypothetical protein
MRALFLLFILLLSGNVPATLASDQTLAELQQLNALLQAEDELAKTGKPYLLIDLQEQQLQLKVSGLPLESWRINHYRSWGSPSSLSATTLEGKSSLDDPERDVQVVNAAAPDAAAASKPFKAFELADMPKSYRLHLGNGTEITVRPTPTNAFARMRSVLAVPAWYLSRPLISNWKSLRGSPYNELALSMTEQDARKLYWAFSEGTPCLIRFPAAVAVIAPTAAGTKQ